MVIILISILESGDTKKEVSEFFDRLTGGKRKAEEEDAEIRVKVNSIMRKINVYNRPLAKVAEDFTITNTFTIG